MSKNNRMNSAKPASPDSEKFHSRSAAFKKENEKTKENGKEKFKDKPMWY